MFQRCQPVRYDSNSKAYKLIKKVWKLSLGQLFCPFNETNWCYVIYHWKA